MAEVQRFAARCEVLALQEIRCTHAETAQFSHYLPGSQVYASCYQHGRAGGVAFVLSPKFAQLFDRNYTEVVLRGRIVVLRCRRNDGFALDVVNAHIFHERFTPAYMHRLLRGALSPGE